MKYILALLLGYISLSNGQGTKTISLNCRVIEGNTVTGGGDISRAKCPRNTLLVSCGIDGWHNIGGTRVRPSRDGVCEAELSEDVTTIQPYGVFAVANCCRFPKAARADSFTTLSKGAKERVTAECPKPSALTGCTVDYERGATNNIKGAFAGKSVMKLERNTRNQCVAQARDGTTSVKAGAQCIKFGNPKYELECTAVTKYGTRGDLTEANTCPLGTQLVSCMTYTTTNTLDDFRLMAGPTCYVQQDNYIKQYANGVCCKLTKTGPNIPEEDGVLVGYDIITVDEDDEEEGYMFVNGVNPEIASENSYNIALMAAVVLLLVIGYGVYKCCSSKNGYQKLSTNDYWSSLTSTV